MSLGGTVVLRDVSLTVQPGEIHALVGLNGAGKTTLMRTLLGMLTPTSGTVSLFGEPVAALSAAGWSHVGQMLEVPFAYPELTVRENVYSAARLHGLSRPRARSATTDAVLSLGLSAYDMRRAGILSTGNRQRVGLAAALVHAPTVIVLDEPSRGLDPRGVIVLRELLQTAARERNAAILVSSHHLDEVARMADRITVLHGGVMVGSLAPGSIDLERQFFDLVLRADSANEARP
ncbi:ABC transporter ATP-binding protein [Cryobacterium sp. PH31-L1]|nr:ABC transporter ATP-binding protein [Cryobacterium sp. PH31-L1]